MSIDIKNQLRCLPQINRSIPTNDRRSVALVGLGDSYLAALAASYLSSGRATAWHSSDISSNPSYLANHTAYIISISGRTAASIKAAAIVKSVKIPTVAITADLSSTLARICKKTLRLNFKTAGRTSGTIGFTSSVVACTHIATQGKLNCPANLVTLYNKAYKASRQISSEIDINKSKSILLLADAHLFPAAGYGALKFNEVFGLKAHAYPLEEFFHAPLFGLGRNDQIIILGANNKKDDDKEKAEKLITHKIKACFINCKMSTPLESFFYTIFFIQHLVILTAMQKGIRECYFMRNKKLLKISSEVIY